jgi:competence protein ComEA
MKFLHVLLLSVVLLGAAPSALADEPTLPPAQVNINTADAETLALVLDGVGPSRAQAIVDYREANGGFDEIEDLLAVRGIGLRTLEINAERIRVRD